MATRKIKCPCFEAGRNYGVCVQCTHQDICYPPPPPDVHLRGKPLFLKVCSLLDQGWYLIMGDGSIHKNPSISHTPGTDKVHIQCWEVYEKAMWLSPTPELDTCESVAVLHVTQSTGKPQSHEANEALEGG